MKKFHRLIRLWYSFVYQTNVSNTGTHLSNEISPNGSLSNLLLRKTLYRTTAMCEKFFVQTFLFNAHEIRLKQIRIYFKQTLAFVVAFPSAILPIRQTLFSITHVKLAILLCTLLVLRTSVDLLETMGYLTFCNLKWRLP